MGSENRENRENRENNNAPNTKSGLSHIEAMKPGFDISRIDTNSLNNLSDFGVKIENARNKNGEIVVRLNSDKKFRIDLQHIEKDGTAKNQGSQIESLELDKGVQSVTTEKYGPAGLRIIASNSDGSTDIAICNTIEQRINQPNLSFMRNPDGTSNYISTLSNITTISGLMRNGYQFNKQDWSTINMAMLGGQHGKAGFNKVALIQPTPDGGFQVTIEKYGLTYQEVQIKQGLTMEKMEAAKKGNITLFNSIDQRIQELDRPKQKVLYINQLNWHHVL